VSDCALKLTLLCCAAVQDKVPASNFNFSFNFFVSKMANTSSFGMKEFETKDKEEIQALLESKLAGEHLAQRAGNAGGISPSP